MTPKIGHHHTVMQLFFFPHVETANSEIIRLPGF